MVLLFELWGRATREVGGWGAASLGLRASGPPTREVQRARLAERGVEPGVGQLYPMLLDEIETQVARTGARVLEVDGRRGVAGQKRAGHA